MGMKQKKKFFFEKKIQNGRLKKTEISTLLILNIFFENFQSQFMGYDYHDFQKIRGGIVL